jgi:outer membrane protein assembly factor BamD (BamD/ComL family)
MNKFYLFLIFFLFGLVCANELIENLYSKNNNVHINLLKKAVFFDSDFFVEEDHLLNSYNQGNYKTFIEIFDQRYPDISVVDSKNLFIYLVSKYKIGEYDSLKNIIPFIKKEDLSLENQVTFYKIQGLSYYWENEQNEFAKFYNYLKQNKILEQDDLAYIEKLYHAQKVSQGEVTGMKTISLEYYLAWNQLKKGNYEKSIEYFNIVQKEETLFMDKEEFTNYGLGVCLYASNKKEEANKKFSLDYKNKSLQESTEFLKIMISFSEMQYKDVINKADDFLAKYSEYKHSSSVKYLKGLSAYYLGNVSQAKRVLEDILDTSLFVRYILGNIYYKEGDYNKSIDMFKYVHDKDKEMLSFYAGYGYAWSAFKLGRYRDSYNTFVYILKNKNINNTYRYNIMMKKADSSYNSNNYPQAERDYRELLNDLSREKDTNKDIYKQAMYNLAKVNMKLRNFDKANNLLAEYLKLVSNDQEMTVIKTIIANNFSQQREYVAATKLYEEILLIHKQYSSEDTYISLADNYFNAEEFEKSLIVYQDYLDNYKNGERDLDARYGIVQALYRLGNYEEALTQAQEVDVRYGINLVDEIKNKIDFQREISNE